MQDEQAFGCIPFRRSKSREIEALMILRTKGFWEFPKGKPEKGETEQETALRELKEETGLVGEIQPESPLSTAYHFTRDGVEYNKTVTLFFCRVQDGASVKVDKHEVGDFFWLPLESLVDRATYPEMKELARKAWNILAD